MSASVVVCLSVRSIINHFRMWRIHEQSKSGGSLQNMKIVKAYKELYCMGVKLGL